MDVTITERDELAAELSVHEGIRQGWEDVANGKTCLAQDVFDEMRRKFGIPWPQPVADGQSKDLA